MPKSKATEESRDVKRKLVKEVVMVHGTVETLAHNRTCKSGPEYSKGRPTHAKIRIESDWTKESEE